MRCLSGWLWAGVCWTLSVGVPHVCPAGTFGDDLALLKKHVSVMVLTDDAGQAHVAVVPEYQGRVMTSTAAGMDGPSYGWINREAIAAGKREPH